MPQPARPTVALLLASVLAGPAGAPDLLSPIFEAAVGGRLFASPALADPRFATPLGNVTDRLRVLGEVRLQPLDTPQILAVEGAQACAPASCCDSPTDVSCCAAGCAHLGDTLALLPAPAAPAVAVIEVALTAANFGANRMHAYIRASGGSAAHSYNAGSAVSAVLARGDPGTPVRTVPLRGGRLGGGTDLGPDLGLHPEEWLEVLGDFSLGGPSDLGAGESELRLYIVFGSATATAGRAYLSELTVTAVASGQVLQGPRGDQGIPTSSHQSQDAAGNTAVFNTVLIDLCGRLYPTNGCPPGATPLPWSIIDTDQVKTPKWFMFDLKEDHFVHSMRVWFASAGRVSQWKFEVTPAPAGDESAWDEVVSVDSPNWPQSAGWNATSSQVTKFRPSAVAPAHPSASVVGVCATSMNTAR